MPNHILIIEDEPSIADNIKYALAQEGFNSTWLSLGGEGISALTEQASQFSLIILDIGLPDMSGFEVCKKIREFSEIPIVFLTARGEEIDRVVGLEIGADDYVVKPFSPRELVARVKVILKRVGVTPKTQQLFTIDHQQQQITYRNKQLPLTSYEFGILATLIERPEQIFSREQLMAKVWSTPEESFDRVIDTHIKTIRAKLRAIDETYNPIITHRGLGYSIKLTMN